MAAPMLMEALVRWQHAAGPFWPYVCAAPFLGAGDGELLARQTHDRIVRGTLSGPPGRQPGNRARRQRGLVSRLLCAESPALAPRPSLGEEEPRRGATQVGAMNCAPATSDPVGAQFIAPAGGGASSSILLVDFPAEPLLAAAPYLVERGWYVVPVVQRWIASPAVLPCRRLMERLMLGAWQARRPASPRGAVLIADGERMGPAGYPTVPGRAFDNRYEYQICRFPSTTFLMAQGVERVQWITSGTTAAERPVRRDLAPYLEDLLRTGLAVDVLSWPS